VPAPYTEGSLAVHLGGKPGALEVSKAIIESIEEQGPDSWVVTTKFGTDVVDSTGRGQTLFAATEEDAEEFDLEGDSFIAGHEPQGVEITDDDLILDPPRPEQTVTQGIDDGYEEGDSVRNVKGGATDIGTVDLGESSLGDNGDQDQDRGRGRKGPGR
jgi:hypothetical protein